MLTDEELGQVLDAVEQRVESKLDEAVAERTQELQAANDELKAALEASEAKVEEMGTKLEASDTEREKEREEFGKTKAAVDKLLEGTALRHSLVEDDDDDSEEGQKRKALRKQAHDSPVFKTLTGDRVVVH